MPPDDVTRMLIAARARITDPERWTQGATAERHDGAVVALCHPLEDDADAWCASGALERAAGSRRNPAFWEGYRRLEVALLAFHTDEDACATAGWRTSTTATTTPPSWRCSTPLSAGSSVRHQAGVMFQAPPLLAYFASLTVRGRWRRQALTLYYDGDGLHIEMWEPIRPLLTQVNRT